MNDPVIKVLVLPGGTRPALGRLTDVGFDIHIRAIVGTGEDLAIPYMRETVWNLVDPPPPALRLQTQHKDGKWVYMLNPDESIRLGFGLVFGGGSQDWYAETALRTSSSTKKLELQDHMEGVPFDPNYRGEGHLFLTNKGNIPIEVYRGWAPAQLKFFCKCCEGKSFLRPVFEEVFSFADLKKTDRGCKWNGSSTYARPFQLELDLPLIQPLIRSMIPK